MLDLSKYVIGLEADLFDEPPIYYKIAEWIEGESSILYITGLSGGGKGYRAKKMAEKYSNKGPITIVELDKLENYSWYIDEKENNQYVVKGDKIIYDFLKNRYDDLSIDYWQDPHEYDRAMTDFMEHLLKYAEDHPNERFIVEGVQIFFDPVFREVTKDQPMIVVRTAKVKSMTKVMHRPHNQIRNRLHAKDSAPDRLKEFINFLGINNSEYYKT